MGIKSTRTISRSTCVRMIREEMARQAVIGALTNYELADILENLRDQNGPNFDNYIVVDDGEDIDE